MNSTDICNMALSAIGQGQIASMEEQSEPARQCRIYYDHLRQELLSAYRWGFAERSVKLAKLNAEVPGWKNVYAYPAACLIINSVYPKDRERRKDDRYREYTVTAVSDSTRAIATDMDDAWADYTADIETAETFSPDFSEALVRLLASALAIPLSGSQSMQQQQYQLMQVALQKAMLTSARQDHHKPEYPERYFNARF